MKKLLLLFAFLIFACSSEDSGENYSNQDSNYFQRLLNYEKYRVESTDNYYHFTNLNNQTDLTQKHYFLSANEECYLTEIYNGSFQEETNIRYEVDYGYDYLNYSQIYDDGDVEFVIYDYSSVIYNNGDVSYSLISYDLNGNPYSTIERNWYRIVEFPQFNFCN